MLPDLGVALGADQGGSIPFSPYIEELLDDVIVLDGDIGEFIDAEQRKLGIILEPGFQGLRIFFLEPLQFPVEGGKRDLEALS